MSFNDTICEIQQQDLKQIMDAQCVQVETCSRCGIEKPFYCACGETVDAEGGFSVLVSGLQVVQAGSSDTDNPSEAFVVLNGQHEFSSTEYRFRPEDAKRLGQLIIEKADEML